MLRSCDCYVSLDEEEISWPCGRVCERLKVFFLPRLLMSYNWPQEVLFRSSHRTIKMPFYYNNVSLSSYYLGFGSGLIACMEELSPQVSLCMRLLLEVSHRNVSLRFASNALIFVAVHR